MDSPRGRIYLMKGILNERIEPTEDVLGHLDQCLDCRACETACPSGVEYGSILEKTRTLLEPERSHGLIVKLLRWFLFRKLLPNRKVQQVFFKILWVQQILGITAIAASWAEKAGCPEKWAPWPPRPRKSAALLPRTAQEGVRPRQRTPLLQGPKGTKKRRVALFTGCLADQLFADVNEATVEVLTRNGCDVDVLAMEQCCGALHIHNGARDQAKELAKVNVRTFNAGRYDAVLTNAPGCSAELRHYAELLDGDAAAKEFGKKIRDISEFLVEIGYTPPRGKLSARSPTTSPATCSTRRRSAPRRSR